MTLEPRRRILEVAIRLFAREGIRAVGVNQIIDEAKVAPMTLYRQFGRKDELVATTLQQWSAEWLRRMKAEIDRRAEDPRAAFVVLWETLEGWFAAEGFTGSFVTNAAIELRSEPDHPAQKVIAEQRMAMRRVLTDLASSAEAHDPNDLAATLQVLIDGAITMALVDRRLAVAPGVRALADAWLDVGSLPRCEASRCLPGP